MAGPFRSNSSASTTMTVNLSVWRNGPDSPSTIAYATVNWSATLGSATSLGSGSNRTLYIYRSDGALLGSAVIKNGVAWSSSTTYSGSFKVLTDASAYPALTQDDINVSGTLHQMAFIKLRVDGTGIIAGSFADERTLVYSVASLKQDIESKAAATHVHTTLSALEITGNVGTDDLQVVNVYIYSGTTPSTAGKPNGTLFVKYVP